jgi:class 3 adenylate cyclase
MTSPLPTGDVTYLFTDIEGSTRLLDRVGERYGGLLAAHHAAIRTAIAAHDGTELKLNPEGLIVNRTQDLPTSTVHDCQAAARHRTPPANTPAH